jgi:putative membrane protein insertion efficiency factor
VNPAQHILIWAVQAYRWTLSPAKTFLFGPAAHCRFTPSCSRYTLDAVKTHGAMTGGWLSAKRVCRCHPWGDCGHDPVPAAEVRGQKAEGRRNNPAGTGMAIAPVHSN